MLEKPAYLFDRRAEWESLSRFVEHSAPFATLGVVSGRRRQGKSMLLTALARASGGFYFGATESTEAESLRQLQTALGEYTEDFVPSFANWDEAIRYLFLNFKVVVLDEFPYLLAASPSLASIIQRELGPDRRGASRTRLLLCGSAMGLMGQLLSGGAPLRGRAGLQMVVHSFDYRTAREFWNIDDRRLALQVHSIVGGTPAYKEEFLRSDSPASADEFDPWVCRTVLNPTTPLFFEGRYLLLQEGGIRDTALYHSILGAVAAGRSTRGAIAEYVGRASGDLGHYLSLLEDVGLLRVEADPLRPARSIFQIQEPLLTFYYGVMRPMWSALEMAQQKGTSIPELWNRSRERYLSGVLGPHFEHLCRDWAAHFAHPSRFTAAGEEPPPVVTAAATVVNDASAKAAHEIDVMVMAPTSGSRPRILSLGEAKWGTVMGRKHLERLLRIRSLLESGGAVEAGSTLPACYSAAGFSEELHELARQGQVLLVGLDDLYG
jgi:uncharacterized protein